MLVGIGDNCIDCYLPPVDRTFVGGNVLNVVANVRKRGGRAAYLGTVGDDPEGTKVLRALQDLGLDTSLVHVKAGKTGITRIRLLGDEYDLEEETYGVSGQFDLTAESAAFLSASAHLIHLATTGPAAGLVADLSALGIPLSCDLGNQTRVLTHEERTTLVPRLEYVFLSRRADVPLTDVRKTKDEITGLGPRRVVITRGRLGCYVYWDGEEFSQPSLVDADIVDPLGAGDAFVGGMLHAILEGLGPHAAAETGSRWAAESCRHYGAW